MFIGSNLKETIRDELISELRKIKDTTLTVLVITLERLFVIKDNTKKFVDKWGKEAETNWYERLLASLNIKEMSLDELSELQSPKQYNKYSRLLSIIQWVNRSALIASGALLVNGQQDMSNWTTLISPFVEIIISRLQIENEEKKNKWYEFTKDTENLLENYRELSRMLKQIKEREFELKGELRGTKAALEWAENEVEYLRFLREKHEDQTNENSKGILTSQLKEKQSLTQQETDQLNNFLESKRTLLIARQQTIKELKQCLNVLEKSFSGKKRAAIGEVGNVMSNTGGAVGILTFGIPKAVGEAIIASNKFSKIKLVKKTSEQFQIFLDNEEKELAQLNQAYDSLINALNLEKETKLFNSKYKIFDIVIKDGVWESRPLTTEKMEKVVISLSENLEELKTELDQEIKELSSKFGTENIKLSLVFEEAENSQEQELTQTAITQAENKQLKQKEKELSTLIISIKKKINRNLHDHLKLLIEQQEELVYQQNINDSSKEVKDLKKDLQETRSKLLKELKSSELENICQKQIEITKLKTQLTDLQTQIQIDS